MIPRFFVDAPLGASPGITLPAAAAHHALNVLRLRDGDPITLFNGRGGEYPGRLRVLGGATASVDLGARDDREAEAPIDVTIAQCLAGADKMDWIVQKAVELGAAAIQPLTSERCVLRLSGVRADKRVDHWRGVAIAASEQCGRNRVPPVGPIQPLAAWLQGPIPDAGARYLLSPNRGGPLLAQASGSQPITLLVGPEGGMAPGEERMAIELGFVPATLGPRVLRTETAAAAALAALLARFGDFG